MSLLNIQFKKDLGVIFDQKFNFLKHIDFVVAKGNSMLGFILRNSKEFNDPYTFKNLYYAFVRSQLEYCSSIWCPSYEIHVLRIEKIQKRFTKVLIKKLLWEIEMPSYKNRCKLFGIMPLKVRRKFSGIVFIRDVLTYHVDCSEILNLIYINVPARMLRNNSFFRIPYHSTNYAANEPLTRCLRDSNSVCDMVDFSFNTCRLAFKNNLISILNNY